MNTSNDRIVRNVLNFKSYIGQQYWMSPEEVYDDTQTIIYCLYDYS